MKRKLIFITALILLLTVAGFMAWDMFFNKAGDNENPYAYDLSQFKKGDSALIMYDEVFHFSPGLTEVHGIAVDPDDRIYVCGADGIEIFDHSGKKETEFPVGGTALCVEVDGDGRIYLGMQEHVEIFDRKGERLMQWKSCGSDAVLTSVACAGSDVFLADAGYRIVYHYKQDGTLVSKLGQKDPERDIDGFVVPSPYFDLGFDRSGELWVVNPGRHRFEQYTPEGDVDSTWGESSMAMEGFCGCCNPSNFAMLADGSFVTSEKGIERIKVYWPNGTFRCVVAGPGSFIEGTRGLDLAVDSKDRVLVLDPEKQQVRIFALKNQVNE